ncbi:MULTISPECIES: PAS domain-containing protein [unclassified Campylobacter]|uniref:PAS domain-containing protein n=1 Tax=unclassified Campylobacter TaxID=2593542 RepID=UPI0022E9980D|nr:MULTISPECIES: PAS domain-containing protein [unclassified Campylobacter]MDA3043832.1 PAS domain-containing protein [Campylobacter sp. JMF_09 ED2]MDA3045260.1 PAS domain-containing protein [Campylobacter sp. JMF_07 ED4]MDA3050280.1 PAS domain-containing protein [Campylobacter sp. JMF_15 NE4]MDA3051826.1 PAS domain-containing protein [Campylobacter sp. JMF_02 ED1]MDA3063100.1 PAS domain-containing protein [Campylobacter sp. JMF_14 EL1]
MPRPTPKNNEIKLDPGRYIVSRTDPKGIITFGNVYFCAICGYSVEELLGQPHNIIRHPDMPKIAFKLMWDTIQKGRDFVAVVKNMAKDGSYYWVMTEFIPKKDPATGEIVEYTAYRKAPPRAAIDIVEPLYKKLCAAEEQGGMEASEALLNEYLKKQGETYESWIVRITGKSNPITALFFKAMRKLFG